MQCMDKKAYPVYVVHDLLQKDKLLGVVFRPAETPFTLTLHIY